MTVSVSAHPRQIVWLVVAKHAVHGDGFLSQVLDVSGIRRGKLVVENAKAVDDQRVLPLQPQIFHEGERPVGRRQRHHGRLPLLVGGEANGFGQTNFKIRIGVVGIFRRGIADEGHAYLVHAFRGTRSFLLIQLSYFAGQPFQRTSSVSFLRFTTASMRNRSSSAVVTF